MNLRSKYEKKSKLKKGDEVVVLTGRSKGMTGVIDSVDLKKDRIFIGGVNLYKKHQKPDMSSESGIVDKVMPLHISNVSLVDPKTKKATRVGYKVEAGKKVRFAKASGTILN
ncbi:MAG: 50S ribosomal protein L24 [Bdellovibrionota bacterium]